MDLCNRIRSVISSALFLVLSYNQDNRYLPLQLAWGKARDECLNSTEQHKKWILQRVLLPNNLCGGNQLSLVVAIDDSIPGTLLLTVTHSRGPGGIKTPFPFVHYTIL